MSLLKTLGKSPGVCSLDLLSSPPCPSLSASSSVLVCALLHSPRYIYNVEPHPESPRWLMKKDRYPDAYRSLIRLRHTELQAARDLYYIHVQLEEESKIIRADTYFKRLSELFTIPRVRRATLASFVVMLAQQLCGINSKRLSSSFFSILANTVISSYRFLLIDGVRWSWLQPPSGPFRLARFRCRQLLVCFPSSYHHWYLCVGLDLNLHRIIDWCPHRSWTS